MKINIHAGHGARGSKSCGAIELICESTENRKVKNECIRLFKEDEEAHTIYDCTVDYPNSKSDCLNKIVALCNRNKVDLDVSIHFNSGANDKNGNNKSCGVEVYVHNSNSPSYPYAKRIVDNISALGFTNRGVKINSGLTVLKKTNSPALLIECCFVDDADDVKLYNYKTMAKAIVEGILNKKINTDSNTNKNNDIKNDIGTNKKYGVLINSYGDIKKANYISERLLKEDKLYNEVIPYNGKHAIKIYPLSPKEKAETVKMHVDVKYHAYSDIIEL